MGRAGASGVYGGIVVVNPSAGATSCADIDLAGGRAVRLATIVASATGAGAPTAWLRFWGEETPGGGTGYARDLQVPLQNSNTQFFPWTGELTAGLPIIGGSEFSAGGRLAHEQVCMRAPAGNAAQGRFGLSGDYVDANPIAVADVYYPSPNVATPLSVLANDTDPEGDTLSVASVGQPMHGQTVTNGTTVTYTPTAGYTGPDSFTYVATDGFCGNAAAVVTLGVAGPK